MDRLIYTAMSGAKQGLLLQAGVAQNLANATTVGYRAMENRFRAVPILGSGLATRAFAVDASVANVFQEGPLTNTGRPLDVAVRGQGWIAVGLVIFAGWNPWRAALGAYIFGALRRLPLDLQAISWLPFAGNPVLGVWLTMIPYLFTIIVLIFSSSRAARQRLGAPAALGLPYIRGERGT